ncbi:general substrate transporter [Naematelia encephala]|uniref:General substrate transporter n=1 Tax=Naematelia encephala TaxID=71784 RepID=A0A1Y2AW08_9TREE|nr:general substrate transporter [Naematelia encephala]
MGFKEDWSHSTPFFIYCVTTYALADLVFGIDSSIFGSLQALPSWLNVFGHEIGGKMALSTYQKAICNSIIFLGRLVGTGSFEPIVERFGYKPLLYSSAVLQCVAVIIQMTAKDWVTFTIGRVFGYVVVGWIESSVPTYSAEIAPPSLRGFAAGLVTPMNTIGAVWGSGMCRAYATTTTKKGYLIPTGVQLAPAVLLALMLPFTAESPRWLVGRGRKEEALRNLRKLRTKSHVAAGLCEAEIELIDKAIEFDKENNTARWLDLFGKKYLRRTVYTALLFFFYTTSGNSFYAAYGPSFLVSIGLGAKSFTYATLVQVIGAVGALQAIFLTDRVGRRPLCIFGASLLILFDCLIAGLGSSSLRTTTANNVVVASFILLIWSEKISWATHAYMMGAEFGGIRMRKKLMMVGTTSDLICNWAVSFCSPYIMNKPYGGIGGKVGYVWGGSAALSLLFAIFCLPETKGRALEEMDELFSRYRWGWEYSKVQTQGVGATIAELEYARADAAIEYKVDEFEDPNKKDETHEAVVSV